MGLFSNRKPTRKNFAMAVLKAAEKRGLGKGSFNEAKFEVEFEDLGSLHLEATYADYRSVHRKYRQMVVDKVVASWHESITQRIPDNWFEAKKQLMPVVRRGRVYNSLMRLYHKYKGEQWNPPDSLPIAGDLETTIAVSFEHGLTVPSADQFKEWGVPFKQALETARENLRRNTTGPIAKTDKGICICHWGDSFESSRILLPEIFHQLDLKGHPVAMVPNRDILLAAGHEDQDALLSMLQGAREFLDKPRWVSFRMYRHDGASWSIFDPPYPEVKKALNQLTLQEKLGDHHQQKGMLEAIHEKQDKELTVSELQGLTAEDGDVLTLCTLTQDVKTLLPVADHVIFERWNDGEAEPNDRALLAWDWAKQNHFPDAQPVTGLFPELYRVHIKSWTDQQWREIKDNESRLPEN